MGPLRQGLLVALCGLSLAAGPASARPAGGHAAYTLGDGSVWRISAEGVHVREAIGALLDRLSRGKDDWLNLSPDGRWLLLSTERFGCDGWACLALVRGDLSAGAAVRAGDRLVHAEGFAAVASGGRLVVFSSPNGPHQIDLWATRRTGGRWTRPALLTRGARFAYNEQPALSADGAHVVFDCGPEPYGAAGTAVCLAPTIPGPTQTLIRPDQRAGGSKRNALHHPDFAPDGSIVFEADWGDSERVWRLSSAGEQPVLVSRVGNDNSPCVLPDGRIVSLWLGRPGGGGRHEVRIARPDGSHGVTLPSPDILDGGIGCGT